MIIHGDCLDELKKLEDNSIDFVCTDPPYGYLFMGKDWDKAVPHVDVWKECLRVLKPGAFACVMSAPRSDVQMHMIQNLTEAGFRLDFTPIYWTYASGFPKAGNIGKLVDKRLGAEREKLTPNPNARLVKRSTASAYERPADTNPDTDMKFLTEPATPQAKALDGSYAGFQPKPAVEVIIVAMKPLSEKTFVDQALKNSKGITWLDDCRIPTDPNVDDMLREVERKPRDTQTWENGSGFKNESNSLTGVRPDGRFPANLLVSDDVLNDGVDRPNNARPNSQRGSSNWVGGERMSRPGPSDSGSYSRYFDLDKWASTLPFLIVPKASKSEKNKGLESFEEKQSAGGGGGIGDYKDDVNSASGKYGSEKAPAKNHHPTVKPLKLMSYLITLGSRKGDIILDPFVGSGTTCLAAKKLGRTYIGIEKELAYVEIAKARLSQEVQASLL